MGSGKGKGKGKGTPGPVADIPAPDIPKPPCSKELANYITTVVDEKMGAHFKSNNKTLMEGIASFLDKKLSGILGAPSQPVALGNAHEGEEEDEDEENEECWNA